MGQKLSLREQIRKNERAINRAIRDIDRERVKMEREQKKIEKDIKVFKFMCVMIFSLFLCLLSSAAKTNAHFYGLRVGSRKKRSTQSCKNKC